MDSTLVIKNSHTYCKNLLVIETKYYAHAPSVGERSNFKKFPTHTRIMVMHSNERGECCLRTLVDRLRKRYINVVDVVVRLHVRPIQVPKARHLRVLHTFGSVTSSPSRSSKRGEVVDEFRQHDGVVTVLVKNNLRRMPTASANNQKQSAAPQTAANFLRSIFCLLPLFLCWHFMRDRKSVV